MPDLRLPHSLPIIQLTRGDDLPEPACAGRSTPFDMLIDTTRGPEAGIALREARGMCGVLPNGNLDPDPEQRCPLVETCLLRDNADEQWAQAILNRLPSTVSPARRRRDAARHDLRAATLRLLAKEGTTIARAAAWFDLTEQQLYKWCHYHGHLDLWHRINGTVPGRNGKKVDAA